MIEDSLKKDVLLFFPDCVYRTLLDSFWEGERKIEIF